MLVLVRLAGPAAGRLLSLGGCVMDTLALLLHGFDVALTPINLMWALIGPILGTAIGILPGIGPALTFALLLPVTVSVGPVAASILFAGVLDGAMYGGSTTRSEEHTSEIQSLMRTSYAVFCLEKTKL